METGLSVFSGTEFLWLFSGLIVAATIASFMIGRWLQQDGQRGQAASMEEIAVMKGGATRFSEAVTAKLVGNNSLEVNDKTGLIVRNSSGGESSAERAILRQVSPVSWKDVTGALALDAAAIRDNLVRKGWLIDGDQALQLRFYQALPFVLVIGVGFYRLEVGAVLGEPVGLLSMLLILAGILALFRFIWINPKTRAGETVMVEAEKRAARLKQAPQSQETGHAVALYGTGVLAGTSFVAFHTMRQNNSGGDSGTSDSNGGDSGCGGGCGGCGG